MLQEGPRTEHKSIDIVAGVHIWFFAPVRTRNRGVGILLHSRWADDWKTFEAPSERTAWVDVDACRVKVRLITSHLPHPGYKDNQYEAELAVIRSARGANGRISLIGLDANAVLGAQ